MKSLIKKISIGLAAIAVCAGLLTIGPIQRAIAQGMVNFTPLVGTEQISLNYPCTVSCYITTNQIAAFAQKGSGAAGTNGQFYVGVTSAAPKFVTMSQDCTTTNAGVVTCLKTNNTAFTTAATTALGTSGATIPLLNGANTYSGASTFSSQIVTSAGLPTIASGACGTTTNGAVVTGSTNQAGNITIGSAGTTTCTVSFSATLGSAPKACMIFPANAAAAAAGTTLAYVSSITTGGFVLTGSALENANYEYLCL